MSARIWTLQSWTAARLKFSGALLRIATGAPVRSTGAIQLKDSVVLKAVKGNYVYIWDPNPEKKKHKVKTEEFREEWTGNIMFFSTGIMQEV